MTDYSYWLDKLAGKDPDPPADRTLLPLGFWRLRDGKPLAVWMDGDRRIAWCGFQGSARELSTRYMESMAESGGFGKAVPEEEYRAAFANGRWADTDPTVASQVTGRNAPADDAETLRDQIEAAKAGADGYAEVADDETAKRAQSLRARLLELGGEAEKRHKTEKAPHLEAGKAVDAKWLPMAKEAKAAADVIRAALSRFETAKAKAAAAAAPTASPAPAKQIRGGYGRPGVVRPIKVAVIELIDRVYEHFRDHPEVAECLRRLAQKAVDAGETVPGVTVDEQRKVS